MTNFLNAKKFKFIFLDLLLLFFSLSFFLQPILAENDKGARKGDTNPPPSKILETLREVATGAGFAAYGDPVSFIIVNIINYLLTLIGVIFILMIIYGGFMWMFSGGNEEKIKKGKEILKSATWGLVIVVLARVLYIFVLERISGGGPTSGIRG